jgi:hypothetical protein
MDHDDDFLDLVAVLALGALSDGESRAVIAHLDQCPACQKEYAELRGAADFVGYAAELEPNELDEMTATRMKSRVMRAVRADVAASATPSVPAAPPARPSAARPPWLVYGALAAAVALTLLESANLARLRSAHADDANRIAALQAQANDATSTAARANMQSALLARRLALVTAPGSKHFAVPNGEVIEANGRILIAFAHLPAPPPGKVYQAWTLARGAKSVAPSITFQPTASGATVIELPESAAKLTAVAVSVEPAGGSRAPTSKPAFVRALS